MGTAQSTKWDPISKKIHDDEELITSLLNKAEDLRDYYDGKIYDITICARKNLKRTEKELFVLELINEACGYVKEANSITKKLISFYIGSNKKFHHIYMIYPTR